MEKKTKVNSCRSEALRRCRWRISLCQTMRGSGLKSNLSALLNPPPPLGLLLWVLAACLVTDHSSTHHCCSYSLIWFWPTATDAHTVLLSTHTNLGGLLEQTWLSAVGFDNISDSAFGPSEAQTQMVCWFITVVSSLLSVCLNRSRGQNWVFPGRAEVECKETLLHLEPHFHPSSLFVWKICVLCVGNWYGKWCWVGERMRRPEAALLRTPFLNPSHSWCLALSLPDHRFAPTLPLLHFLFPFPPFPPPFHFALWTLRPRVSPQC